MDTHFDVLVLGTGLTQSIVAAALAKAGFKVAHIDRNSYYGADEASLSHDELLQWAQSPPPSFSSSTPSSHNPLPFSRSYSLSLAPALISSAGPLIASLIQSGVSRYGQFKLLDAVYIYRHGALQRVPGNKEDVFKARDVSLVDKRKLMRFLQFAAGEFEGRTELQGQQSRSLGEFMKDKFSLSEDACDAILYALAYCSSSSDPTLPALTRLRGFLQSAGRYGNSPFLIGHYGGLGELAQGFCRTCAVKGGTYILGREILALHLPSDAPTPEEGRASIHLKDVPDVLTADLVITSSEYLTTLFSSDSATLSMCACGIAITNCPINFPASFDAPSLDEDAPIEVSQPDTAVTVFPPGSLPEGNASSVVRVLQMGEATLSCPHGKYVLYLWTQTDTSCSNPEELLRPYLSALTSASSEDGPRTSSLEFSFFYTRCKDTVKPTAPNARTLIVPPLHSAWSEIADRSTQDAEDLFWTAVKELSHGEDCNIEGFWSPLENVDEDVGDDW